MRSREVKIHSVKYNLVMNFILTASTFIFPLITFPYASRVLQASGNGRIAFASSVANYFMMVASLGIPTYGIRACARVRDNRDELSKTAQEILIINLFTTFIVTAVYLISIVIVPKFHQDKVLFLINTATILLNMFGADWLYQAMEQYDYITVRSLVFKIVSVVLMFLLVHNSEDYIVYGCITVFAGVGSNVLNFVRLPRLMSFKRYDNYNFRRHIKPIFILFAQNLAVSIYTNLDTIMLGFMKTPAEVGYYNAATKLKGLQMSLVSALGTVLLPRMSLYVKRGDNNQFEATMVMALNFTACLAVAVTSYCVVESSDMILFLAGRGYTPAIPAMQLITLAVIANGINGILGTQTLIPLGKEAIVLVSVITGAIVDLLLNLILIPSFGATGAAFSTMVTEYIVAGVQAIALKHILIKNRNSIHLLRYLLIGFISGFFCLLAQWECVNLSTISRILVTFLVFDISFIVLLYIARDTFVLQVKDQIRKRY